MADRKIRSTFSVQCSTLQKDRKRSPRRLRSLRDDIIVPALRYDKADETDQIDGIG
ncbi:MAG TPA: hypothetical protein PK344_02425 [Syntrophorhabdaceae bacterium]|nr:hypothetical protein [Syntrophorhabdaceae bacterium]